MRLAWLRGDARAAADNVDNALAGARDAEESVAQTWYGRDQERTPEVARWLRESGTLPRSETAPFGERRGRTGFAELGERVHEAEFAELLARYQTRGRRSIPPIRV